jgi:hypothetical protein
MAKKSGDIELNNIDSIPVVKFNQLNDIIKRQYADRNAHNRSSYISTMKYGLTGSMSSSTLARSFLNNINKDRNFNNNINMSDTSVLYENSYNLPI